MKYTPEELKKMLLESMQSTRLPSTPIVLLNFGLEIEKEDKKKHGVCYQIALQENSTKQQRDEQIEEALKEMVSIIQGEKQNKRWTKELENFIELRPAKIL